jgi:hypothetical protein
VLYGEFFFKSHVVSGTLTADGTASTITFPAADVGGDNDQYNGWLVEDTTNDEVRMVVDYNGNTYTATVHDDFDTTPASGNTYALYKRFNLILPPSHSWVGEHISSPIEGSVNDTARGNLMTVLRITDLEDTKEIARGSRVEDYDRLITTTGTPTEWIPKGNSIVFNYAPTEERWYKADYYRLPKELSSATDEPEIPEAFHWAIVLWGAMWAAGRYQENATKYSYSKDFESFMAHTKTDYDVMLERISSYGVLRRE